MTKALPAILFDLDDTLNDRRASIRAYAQRFHTDFGSQLQPMQQTALTSLLIASDHGGYLPRAEVAAALSKTLPWTAPTPAADLHTHWMEHFPQSTQPRAHARKVLQHLHDAGHVIGLVTNGSTIGQNRKIDVLGMRSYFSTIVISEEAGVKKPAAAIFQLALQQIQMRPEETWFVGDNPRNDIMGAADVGLTPIWLRGMHEWPAAHTLPEHIIDSLDEIIPLVSDQPDR